MKLVLIAGILWILISSPSMAGQPLRPTMSDDVFNVGDGQEVRGEGTGGANLRPWHDNKALRTRPLGGGEPSRAGDSVHQRPSEWTSFGFRD